MIINDLVLSGSKNLLLGENRTLLINKVIIRAPLRVMSIIKDLLIYKI